ncbi:7505_t:CDS:2, partial [Scutellospora calospora]
DNDVDMLGSTDLSGEYIAENKDKVDWSSVHTLCVFGNICLNKAATENLRQERQERTVILKFESFEII